MINSFDMFWHYTSLGTDSFHPAPGGAFDALLSTAATATSVHAGAWFQQPSCDGVDRLRFGGGCLVPTLVVCCILVDIRHVIPIRLYVNMSCIIEGSKLMATRNGWYVSMIWLETGLIVSNYKWIDVALQFIGFFGRDRPGVGWYPANHRSLELSWRWMMCQGTQKGFEVSQTVELHQTS